MKKMATQVEACLFLNALLFLELYGVRKLAYVYQKKAYVCVWISLKGLIKPHAPVVSLVATSLKHSNNKP